MRVRTSWKALTRLIIRHRREGDKMTEYYVTEEDARKEYIQPVKVKCKECGHTIIEFPTDPLGRVQKCDIGKKCKKINGHWYVENSEQFEKRTGKIWKDGKYI